MKKILLVTLSLAVLVSCSEDEKPAEKPKTDTPEVVDQTTDFEGDHFKNKKHLELLKELDICVMSDSLGILAECNPKNFKIIPFKKDTPVEDAFILEMKAGIRLKNSATPLPAVRHVVVFERTDGELVKVNGFRGDIIATQKGEKADDLILALYLTKDETLFHCLYVWDGDRYKFESVERMDYGDGFRTLTDEHRQEMTTQIYNDIIESNLVF